MTGFLCSPRIYRYDGWFFEWGFRPWPLRKNGNPRETAGRDFYEMFDRFSALSKEDQENYRVGGGCIALA